MQQTASLLSGHDSGVSLSLSLSLFLSLYDPLPKDPSLACWKFLKVLNVLKFLNRNVMNLLKIPKDSSLACWALFVV